MAKPRVKVVDAVPRARQRRTPAAEPTSKLLDTSLNFTPTESIGRLPAIGIDNGAIPGTRPEVRSC